MSIKDLIEISTLIFFMTILKQVFWYLKIISYRVNFLFLFQDNQIWFNKETNYLNLNSSYDVKSIMHYYSYAFSKNPDSSIEKERYSILSKTEPRIIEYNTKLSAIDIKEIQTLYKCTGE